jgi:hypothetical protein
MDAIVAIERGLRGSVSMLVSLLLWYLIPSQFLHVVAVPPAILNQGELLAFALLIGGLSAVSHVFQEEPLGFICGIGSSLATVMFLYLGTAGGVLTFQEQSLTVTANFQPLLYLLVAPSVLSMVRKSWGAISASAGRPSLWVERG